MLVVWTGTEGDEARVQTVPFAHIPLLKVWLWWRTGGRTAEDDGWRVVVRGCDGICVCAHAGILHRAY